MYGTPPPPWVAFVPGAGAPGDDAGCDEFSEIRVERAVEGRIHTLKIELSRGSLRARL
jgi:hypothetical protein